jgi:anti-anti-sigma factor
MTAPGRRPANAGRHCFVLGANTSFGGCPLDVSAGSVSRRAHLTRSQASPVRVSRSGRDYPAVPASVTPSSVVVVSLPGEIDLTNAGETLALITAAFRPSVTVVIADLTVTRFCDSAGPRHLLQAHQHAAEAGVQLRLVIPPRGPVGRARPGVTALRAVAERSRSHHSPSKPWPERTPSRSGPASA